jgi:hypothetical protein
LKRAFSIATYIDWCQRRSESFKRIRHTLDPELLR